MRKSEKGFGDPLSDACGPSNVSVTGCQRSGSAGSTRGAAAATANAAGNNKDNFADGRGIAKV